jgi:two-component sensor histidine kinase
VKKGWSIRGRLTLVTIAVALPFLLLTAGIAWKLAENQRETQREAILFSNRALMNAVDTLLRKQEAVARILSSSPALLSGDFAAFRQEAQRVRPSLSGGWILVADQEGRQILNLVRPDGTPLPNRSPEALQVQHAAARANKAQVSSVFAGTIVPSPLVTVEIPVARPGQPPLGLAVVMETRSFLPLFDEQHLPDGWFAALIDHSGNFIARSRDGHHPAPAGLNTATANDDAVPDGSSLANAQVTSDLSGWAMRLAVDKEVFEGPIRHTLFIATLAGGAATLLSVLLAIWAASRISNSIVEIERGTRGLLRREPIAFARTGVSEVDSALDAFVSTANSLEQHEKYRDEREAHVRLIMRELSHRSKNLLAIVLAIARQTARNTKTFDDFESRFSARIQSLASAHDLLVEQQWSGAALDDLIRSQLSAFGMERVICHGDRVILRAEAVQNVALALHELATNASKYGALSVTDGRVEIEWALQGDAPDTRALQLVWREVDGPPVVAPTRRGFGIFVLERATVSALGSGTVEFKESGLVWTCIIAGEHLIESDRPSGRAPDVVEMITAAAAVATFAPTRATG